jgi:hypothetical protein
MEVDNINVRRCRRGSSASDVSRRRSEEEEEGAFASSSGDAHVGLLSTTIL